MKQYKIIVAYDGSDYFGWQVQKNQPSIAQTLQKAFNIAFEHNIKLIGASRTDTGVHALGQVARFTTDLPLEPSALLGAWNNVLPNDIVIRSLDEVPADFHPLYNVKQKTYWYHFFLKRPLPFIQRYGWYYHYPINLEKLHKSFSIFLGTHDFRSFCTGYDTQENTIRTIDALSLEYIRRFNIYRITVKGPGFLRHMIRRIVGACLDVAAHDNVSIDYLHDVLQQKNPRQTLPNASAKGLLLYKIMYKSKE